jgi:hypothetical protein
MYYAKSVTATAGTTKENAETTIIKCSAGILHHVHIFIPRGHHGQAHIVLEHGLHQILPASPDADISGDNESLDFKEYIPLTASENEIKLRYWNTDNINNHTFHVLIGVLLPEDLDVISQVKVLVEKIVEINQRFDRLLGRLGV